MTSCINSNDNYDENFDEISIVNIIPSDRKINLSKLFEMDYNIIKLQTNDTNMFGQVNKSYLDSEFIVILDKYQTMGLYFFNNNGEFLFKINDYGEGPDKYKEIGSFSINKKNKEITISQTFPSKFFIYDFEGKLKETKYINEYAWDFIELYNGNIWLYTFNSTLSKELAYNLLFVDSKGKILNSYLESVPEDPTQLHSMVNNFFQFSDSISFMLPFKNIIYDVSGEVVKQKYRILFQGNEIHDDFYTKYYSEVQSLSPNLKKLINYFEKNELAYNIESFYETKDKLILQYHFKRRINFTIYNKKTFKSISTSYFENDINKLNCNFVYSHFNPQDEKLTQFIDAYLFKNQIKEILKRLDKEDLDRFTDRHKKLMEIYLQTKNRDNPILIQYKLKDI